MSGRIGHDPAAVALRPASPKADVATPPVTSTATPGRVLAAYDVPLPRPRRDYDARARPEFAGLRAELWTRIREMVISDPGSDFFRRPG